MVRISLELSGSLAFTPPLYVTVSKIMVSSIASVAAA